MGNDDMFLLPKQAPSLVLVPPFMFVLIQGLTFAQGKYKETAAETPLSSPILK